MNDMLKNVCEFNERAGIKAMNVTSQDVETLTQTIHSRMRLIFEEYGELADAVLSDNLVEILDGAADLIYVVLGTVHVFGLSEVFDEVWQVVHSSNMKKLENKITLDSNGKIRKPEGWEKPNIQRILEKFKERKFND